MYKLLLISKYLRKRRIAWVSLVAVCLCTAMVLVVLSVMGGWLRMFRDSFQGLSGSVLVNSRSLTGLPYYEEMIKRMEALPEVTAAAPILQTFGLLGLYRGGEPQAALVNGVQVMGIPADKIAKINRFPKSLFRQYQQLLEQADDSGNGLTTAEREGLRKQAAANLLKPSFALPLNPEVYRKTLPKALKDPSTYEGMIAGSGVLQIGKNAKGEVEGRFAGMYQLRAKLTVLGVPASGQVDMKTDSSVEDYWIVDDSHTKVWQYDSGTVYVSFDNLQNSLGMKGDGTSNDPARTTEIDIATKPGADLTAVAIKIQAIVDDVLKEKNAWLSNSPEVKTWEQSQAKYLNAIEHEVVLVTVLFSFISVVAVFLIFCIFYMIVAEKTKDIGIIKSVGATSAGVAAIFIGYGCAIGIVGGGAGLLVGGVIVHNINFLHEQMGRLMGVKIWDPEVYAFDTIPSTVDPKAAVIIGLVAVVSSVLGAIIPALRAARLNPVEALRFE